MGKGKVGRVEEAKRLVLWRGERLGGEDGTGGTVRRGWVEVGKGKVGRVEGAERLVLRRGERLRGKDGAGGKVRRGWVEVGKGEVRVGGRTPVDSRTGRIGNYGGGSRLRIRVKWEHNRERRTAAVIGLCRFVQLVTTGMRGERIRTLGRHVFELICNDRQFALDFVNYRMVIID